uniref:Pentacotripeptide-repeat region of PRORP domain-containing protein n=1 Tax=Oryza nivara TaxID=4536 RepID=A0A0E0FKN6_ORYNI
MAPPTPNLSAAARLVIRRFLTTGAEAAEAVAPHAARAKGKKDKRPLGRRLLELGDAAGEGSVSRVLDEWVREGREEAIAAADLAKCARDLHKVKRDAHALELMDWMVNTKGMSMTYARYALHLELLYSVYGIEAAEEYFSGIPSFTRDQNHRTYGALLNCYCSAKMEEKATNIYHRMDELGIPSSTKLMNNLMGLYLELGQHSKSCSTQQDRCCQRDFLHVTLDVPKQWSIFRTLGSIYMNAGMVEEAELAFMRAQEFLGFDHGRHPFYFLMRQFASIGSLRGVNRVWKDIKMTFSYNRTNFSYLLMLQCLYKLGDTDRMKEIYKEWEYRYENYDPRLTNMLTRAHLRNGMTNEAELLWEKVKERGGDFDFETCELFREHYLGKGDTTSALKWAEKMTKLPKKQGKQDQETCKFLKWFEEDKVVEGAKSTCNCSNCLRNADSKTCEPLLAPADLLPD